MNGIVIPMLSKKIIGISVIILAIAIMIAPASNASSITTHNSLNSFAAIKGFTVTSKAQWNMPVTATIIIPLKNLNLLNTILMQVSNPNSPYYRHFLNRSQAEELFTNFNEFNYVLSTLKTDGFKIEFTAFSSIIVANGNSGMFSKIFGTNVYIYSNGTAWYYSTPNVINFHGAQIFVTNGSSILFQHPSTFVSPQLVKAEKNKFQSLNETFSIEPYPTTSLQTVYNITGLLNSGVTGKGKTIGILDFAGNPYIKYQLDYYDSIYGLPNPPNFTITPIGPYDPNMGIATGWDGEISLDVESSHTMAPGANITLYIANYNLNLAPVIAFIDQQDSVNTLSQSFSIPESLMAEFPAMLEYLNVQLADYYYEIGSAMGITFSASTGDAGGSGYSSGPIGTVGYPSTSPFVTALGGTTTFLTFNSMGQVSSFYQTAWSNYGFVPNNINYGGSTGGISSLEPKPWYQFSMSNIKGYPNGRMVPDVSLEANVFPGMVFVFGQNMTGISGGTSEASPLFAGLITLIDSDINGSLGLVNPMLYQLASNLSMYQKLFYPITSGYNIPWTTNYGYNLVTGLGALNAGEFASILSSMKGSSAPMLMNNFTVTNSSGMQVYEVYPGEKLVFTSVLSISNKTVKNAQVNFLVDSLSGISNFKAIFNNTTGEYSGSYIVPNNVSGNVFVYSLATYNGTYSNSYEELYFGYYVTSYTIMPQGSYYFNVGVQFIGSVTTIMGQPVNTTLTLNIYSYNILNNTYYLTNSQTDVKAINGNFETIIMASIPVGVTLIEANNSYLYLPLFNGFNLQSSLILGPEEVEPGAVAPGQYIYVLPAIIPGYNLFDFNPAVGSNVTFSLLNSNGKVISSVFATPGMPAGLYVPMGTAPGLYTILINATYNSYSYGMSFYGEFYGQILVTGGLLNSKMWLSSSNLSEGQNVVLFANITYNGTPVQYGMFSAALFPTDLSNSYYLITAIEQIPLYYDSSLGLWVGDIQLPSQTSPGSISIENGLTDWAGNYTIYLTGINAQGVATNNNFTSYLQFNLTNPIIDGIQAELKTLQNEINSNSQLTQSQINSIESELTGIQNQLNYLNKTMKYNVSSLQSTVSSLQKSLSNEKLATQSQGSSLLIAVLIGLVALIVALLAIARKRKA